MGYDVNDFEREVLKRSHSLPVVVDFWAPWCGPCRILGPVLERLAGEAGDRWALVKVNTEENQELAMAFDIRSIPAVKLFRDGKVAAEFLGALPEAEIRKWLAEVLPSPNTGIVSRARSLLTEGRRADAASLLEPVVTAEPANADARLTLAEALLEVAPERVSAVVQPIGADSEAYERAWALRSLAGFAALAADPDALPSSPLRVRFVEGAKAVRRGDYAGALEAFIEVLQRDRAYFDEAPKRACKAIFQLLGIRHPVSERYHRAFSSALHS